MFAGLVKWLLPALLLTSAVGCGSASGGEGNGTKAQSYPQDGYMGMTSVNPNNPLNPTYHHYQDDTALMKAVLAQLPGIADSSIVLRGPEANVKIRPQQQLTAEQVEELRTQAQLALDTNMPRYRIKVTMSQR